MPNICDGCNENGSSKAIKAACANESKTFKQKLSILLSKVLFQKLLVLSTFRLFVYLNKLYQDFYAVNKYYTTNEVNFCLISIAALITPIIMYTFYWLCIYTSENDLIQPRDIGTRIVNGFLLIPWQIKRHLDVVHFTAERACEWRTADEEEKTKIKSLKRTSIILQFFQDFYAGFLQLLLQFYILLWSDDWVGDKQLFTRLLIWQLIGSALSISSLMASVRREDDGLITCFLSLIGWLCVFISRILVFSLIAKYIDYWLIVLCSIHIIAFSIWIYNISDAKDNKCLTQKKRPFIFLGVIVVENALLSSLWAYYNFIDLKQPFSDQQIVLIFAVGVTTLAGFVFIAIYSICKLKLTRLSGVYNAEANTLMILTASDSITQDRANKEAIKTCDYGIYSDFCDMDFASVKEYYNDADFKFCIVSILSLILPSLIYAFYQVSVELEYFGILSWELVKTIGTRFVDGFLLILWQLKRHLDVIKYSAQRACECRGPRDDERLELASKLRYAEILEFFEDFLAGDWLGGENKVGKPCDFLAIDRFRAVNFVDDDSCPQKGRWHTY
ncbi:hypothetical protein B4U79_12784 [Dinothrombium tinctorium]|uniref:XK-related protein n=1 Tax=Dinothrombium tinctorium TaxID=1965070 RepID=A0A443R4G2_9ACAR|nr:hypothetical protein B4U79_12784 [Dinothrombium tinctorium]